MSFLSKGMERFLREFVYSLTVCLVVTGAVACGGGGGGGGTDSGSDDAFGVRVLHAAIDGAPVDVVSTVKSSPVLSQQVFAGSKGYRSLPSGAQALALTRTASPTDVIESFNVSIAKGDKYTILLFGDVATFGLRSQLIKDEVPGSVSGAAVRVVHGVTRAAELTVNIGGTPAPVSFGDYSDYVVTSSGVVTISAVRSADGHLVQSGSFELSSGKAYTLLLAGEVGYYVKGVLFSDS